MDQTDATKLLKNPRFFLSISLKTFENAALLRQPDEWFKKRIYKITARPLRSQEHKHKKPTGGAQGGRIKGIIIPMPDNSPPHARPPCFAHGRPFFGLFVRMAGCASSEDKAITNQGFRHHQGRPSLQHVPGLRYR